MTDADAQLDNDDKCNHRQVRMGQLDLNEQHEYNFEVRYYTGDMSLYKYGETQSRQVEKKWQANHILTIVVFVVTKVIR